ncbi:MAG: hypothetical protein KGI37_06375 [Alphaproteobacteria bacterium]|nr:hypothetical protein [Alphaproteobacteria bacterium]
MPIIFSKLKKLLFPHKGQTPTEWITEMQQPLDPKDPNGLTKGHIKLLSYFETAGELKPFGWRDGWWIVFHQVPVQEVMDKFVKAGLLIPATVADFPDTLNTKQCKAVLTKLGLPIPRARTEMVKKIQASGYDISADYPHGDLWKCSDVALAYLEKMNSDD